MRLDTEGDGRANDTYGFALAAHPGKSQGRPTTNTGSKPIEQDRPARPRLLPDAPVPDGRTVLTSPDAQGIEAVEGHSRHLCRFIRDTNSIENLNRQIRNTIKTRGHFPDEQAATKLIYLAILRAEGAWKEPYNWTGALRGLKIHFGDRLPD
jgi:Transposase, Mutator family